MAHISQQSPGSMVRRRRLLVAALSVVLVLAAAAAHADEGAGHAPAGHAPEGHAPAGHAPAGHAPAGHASAAAAPPAHGAPANPDASATPASRGTPEEVLALLRAGNERFKAGTSTHPHLGAKRRLETVPGEHPVATIVSCSDSRVPPELLFDEGLGDLFSIRVAGNVVDTLEMGSVEYGADRLDTSLLVVMGHTKCGVIADVATHATVHGHGSAIVERLEGAIEASRKEYPAATDTDIIPEATRANVFQSIATLLRESEVVRARVASGKTQVVGAIYDVETGSVEWLGRHRDETSILAEKKSASAHAAPSHGSKPAPRDGHGAHDSAPGHGASASASSSAHASHGAAPPAPPPAPSVPSPLTFVLVAVLCTIGGSISGRLTAKKAD